MCVRLRCQHFHFVAAALVDSENTAQIEAFLVASMKYANKTVEILKEIGSLELLKIDEIDDPTPPPTEARLALLKDRNAWWFNLGYEMIRRQEEGGSLRFSASTATYVVFPIF